MLEPMIVGKYGVSAGSSAGYMALSLPWIVSGLPSSSVCEVPVMDKIWNRMHATRYPGASHASPLLPAQHDTPRARRRNLFVTPAGRAFAPALSGSHAHTHRHTHTHAHTHERMHNPIEKARPTDKHWQTGKPSFHQVRLVGWLLACPDSRLCGLAAWDGMGWHGMGWDACLRVSVSTRRSSARSRNEAPYPRSSTPVSILGTIRDCGPRLCENGNGLSRRWSRPQYLPLPAIARLGTRALLFFAHSSPSSSIPVTPVDALPFSTAFESHVLLRCHPPPSVDVWTPSWEQS